MRIGIAVVAMMLGVGAWGQKAQPVGVMQNKTPEPLNIIAFTKATSYDFLLQCESASAGKSDWWKVKNCKIPSGHTLDEVMNQIGKEKDAESLCGDWGPWIHDKQGNIIGKFRNPPCSTHK